MLLDLGLVKSVHAVRAALSEAAGRLDLPPPARLAVAHLASALVRPTLAYDLPGTVRRREEASERVRPVVVHVRRGEAILEEGDVIDRRHLLVFRGIRAQTREGDVLAARAAAAGLVALLALLLWGFARRPSSGRRPRLKDAAVLAALLLLGAGLSAASLLASDVLHARFPRAPAGTFVLLVPFAAGAAVVRCVLSAELAMLFAVAGGSLAALAAGGGSGLVLHAVATSMVAAGLGPRGDARGLLRVGSAVAAVGVLVTVGLAFVNARPGEAVAPALAAAVAGLVLLPPAGLACLAALQRLYLTDLQLQALANLNHPALKDLIIQAPGTYHHVLVTGALAEAAARAAGARPLLARVGAYYHDLGKLRNPGAYGENQRAEGAASLASPAVGAALVKRHVPDGVELARRWRLPREVFDIVLQHHGTRLVASYWSRAQARAREAGEAQPDEATFRYPGPTPRSREAALVMLADSCEASARALADPDEPALRALVARRTAELHAEGQLVACELTLRELAAAEAAIADELVALHAERARRGAAGGEAEGRPLQLVREGSRQP